jgi:hypothetical protein
MDAGASAADGGRLRFDYVVDDLNKPKNNKISTTGTPVVKPRLSPESRGFGSPSTHVCRWKGKWHPGRTLLIGGKPAIYGVS